MKPTDFMSANLFHLKNTEIKYGGHLMNSQIDFGRADIQSYANPVAYCFIYACIYMLYG